MGRPWVPLFPFYPWPSCPSPVVVVLSYTSKVTGLAFALHFWNNAPPGAWPITARCAAAESEQ